MNKSILIFVLILLSQASFGGLTHKEVLKKYTLEQLDSAANLLMYSVDLSLDGKDQTQVCYLNKEQSFAFINEIKALIDIKLKALKKRVPVSWEKCEQECHCGVYARFGEVLNIKKISSKELSRLKLIEKKSTDQSSEKLKSCVANTQWFCKSQLLQYLKTN